MLIIYICFCRIWSVVQPITNIRQLINNCKCSNFNDNCKRSKNSKMLKNTANQIQELVAPKKAKVPEVRPQFWTIWRSEYGTCSTFRCPFWIKVLAYCQMRPSLRLYLLHGNFWGKIKGFSYTGNVFRIWIRNLFRTFRPFWKKSASILSDETLPVA